MIGTFIKKIGPAGLVLKWAEGLRFPYLVGLTGVLFGIDLLVPDFIPLADELLLGLATLVLASFKKRKALPPPPENNKPPT